MRNLGNATGDDLVRYLVDCGTEQSKARAIVTNLLRDSTHSITERILRRLNEANYYHDRRLALEVEQMGGDTLLMGKKVRAIIEDIAEQVV